MPECDICGNETGVVGCEECGILFGEECAEGDMSVCPKCDTPIDEDGDYEYEGFSIKEVE